MEDEASNSFTSWDAVEVLRSADPEVWGSSPPWTRVLFEAGTALAKTPTDDPKATLAISVPETRFVAGIVGAGYATERLQLVSFTTQFSPGDMIVVIPGGHDTSAFRAKFRGYLPRLKNVPGIDLPGIEYQFAQGARTILKEWRRGGIRIARYTGTGGLLKRRKSHVSIRLTGFATSVGGVDAEVWLAGLPILAIIGDREDLAEELAAVAFRYVRYGADLRGSLGDLLTIEDNGNTRILGPTSSAESYEAVAQWGPELVIFSRASAYSKWRHQFRRCHKVLILDRSQRTYDSEFEILADTFSQRKADILPRMWPDHRRTGIELLGFEA